MAAATQAEVGRPCTTSVHPARWCASSDPVSGSAVYLNARRARRARPGIAAAHPLTRARLHLGCEGLIVARRAPGVRAKRRVSATTSSNAYRRSDSSRQHRKAEAALSALRRIGEMPDGRPQSVGDPCLSTRERHAVAARVSCHGCGVCVRAHHAGMDFAASEMAVNTRPVRSRHPPCAVTACQSTRWGG